MTVRRLCPSNHVLLILKEARCGNQVPQSNELCEELRGESISEVKISHPVVILHS
jgi:hypothetical protein